MICWRKVHMDLTIFWTRKHRWNLPWNRFYPELSRTFKRINRRIELIMCHSGKQEEILFIYRGIVWKRKKGRQHRDESTIEIQCTWMAERKDKKVTPIVLYIIFFSTNACLSTNVCLDANEWSWCWRGLDSRAIRVPSVAILFSKPLVATK